MVKSLMVVAGLLAITSASDAAVYSTIQPTGTLFCNQGIVCETATGTATARFGSRHFFVEGLEAPDNAAIGLATSGSYGVTVGTETIDFNPTTATT